MINLESQEASMLPPRTRGQCEWPGCQCRELADHAVGRQLEFLCLGHSWIVRQISKVSDSDIHELQTNSIQ